MRQSIFFAPKGYKKIANEFNRRAVKKYLLVCGSSFDKLNLGGVIATLKAECVRFSNFSPNPTIEQVACAVETFNKTSCDAIIAIGGGSAIDVAKCVKLFSSLDKSEWLNPQKYVDNGVLLIAVPTTAGTGSESTRYSVIYSNGEKQSVRHSSIVPNVAVLDGTLLKNLPDYQKKCTFLDALSQAIEGWWSVHSTPSSIKNSKKAIKLLLNNVGGYLGGNEGCAKKVLLGANYSGRAINVTQTTAAHAMSYKLTSLYSIPHGLAVALCLPKIWSYMINNFDKCTDVRGEQYLQKTFSDIAYALCKDTSPRLAIKFFEELVLAFGLKAPNVAESDIVTLAKSVNVTRLGNNPISLEFDAIKNLYAQISN